MSAFLFTPFRNYNNHKTVVENKLKWPSSINEGMWNMLWATSDMTTYDLEHFYHHSIDLKEPRQCLESFTADSRTVFTLLVPKTFFFFFFGKRLFYSSIGLRCSPWLAMHISVSNVACCGYIHNCTQTTENEVNCNITLNVEKNLNTCVNNCLRQQQKSNLDYWNEGLIQSGYHTW